MVNLAEWIGQFLLQATIELDIAEGDSGSINFTVTSPADYNWDGFSIVILDESSNFYNDVSFWGTLSFVEAWMFWSPKHCIPHRRSTELTFLKTAAFINILF